MEGWADMACASSCGTPAAVSHSCACAASSRRASACFGQELRKKAKRLRACTGRDCPQGLDFDLANDEASRPRRSWSSWFFGGSGQAWPGTGSAAQPRSFSPEDSNRSETTEETAFHDHDIEAMSDDQFLI